MFHIPDGIVYSTAGGITMHLVALRRSRRGWLDKCDVGFALEITDSLVLSGTVIDGQGIAIAIGCDIAYFAIILFEYPVLIFDHWFS